ncbi:TniB family NTP-binding protein [Streptomyces canus]
MTARPSLIVTGPATTGKTTALLEVGRTCHLAHTRRAAPGDDSVPVAYVLVPPGATAKTLAGEFARYLGIPVTTRMTTTQITTAVCHTYTAAGIKLVLIDEIHRLNPRTSSGSEVADWLKDLTERVRATFVYAGIDVTASTVFSGVRGAQLAGRASLIDCGALPARAGQREPFRELIAALEAALDLHAHRTGSLPRLAPYLHERTAGRIGSLARLIRQAAIEAILDGTERITKILWTASRSTTSPKSTTGPATPPAAAPAPAAGDLPGRNQAIAPPVRAATMWPSVPGPLRVQPLPGEATASYLTRLAATYRLTPAQLLDGLATTVTGTEHAPPATDIHLSAEAAHRLSAFTRIPPAHLTRALARQPPPASIGTARAAIALWQPVPPAVQPLPACTACTIRRSPHQAAPAWIHPATDSPRIMICARHQQASRDPRHPAPLDIRAVPELTQAHLRSRRPATPVSLSWASTITTRWYDHHQHLHQRWRMRLHQLTAANPHIPTGPASPALTCRDLITYPETLTLATALDRLPPHPLTRPQQTAFLHHLAGHLRLPRLAPADHDLLWQRLHTR